MKAVKKESQQNTEQKLRQIIIETDGKEIWIRKAETSNIELVAIMEMVIRYVSDRAKKQDK